MEEMIRKVLSIRYHILLGPELLCLVPRTLLIIGIVSEAERQEIGKEKEDKTCVAHLEAVTVWIHCLLNILMMYSALYLPSECIQNIETNNAPTSIQTGCL